MLPVSRTLVTDYNIIAKGDFARPHEQRNKAPSSLRITIILEV